MVGFDWEKKYDVVGVLALLGLGWLMYGEAGVGARFCCWW